MCERMISERLFRSGERRSFWSLAKAGGNFRTFVGRRSDFCAGIVSEDYGRHSSFVH